MLHHLRTYLYDSSNGDRALADCKTRMAPRDSLSISEMPDFLSTTGSSSQYLHINPATHTDIESGGAHISGYDNDYDGDIRQGSPGYTGTGNRPDIGADEFEGTRLSAPLPLTLIFFKVSHSDSHNNKISWSTSQENNTSLFIIERGRDGHNFSVIGQLPAAGNSNNPRNYNFIDSTPLKGINYYRLKIIDKDNKIKYSEIKSIKNTGSIEFRVFPNPVSNIINIVLNIEDAGTATIFITDESGKVVIKKLLNLLNGSNVYTIDVNNITKGIYVIKLQTGENIIVKKINKM